jgi:hypothetical protein
MQGIKIHTGSKKEFYVIFFLIKMKSKRKFILKKITKLFLGDQDMGPLSFFVFIEDERFSAHKKENDNGQVLDLHLPFPRSLLWLSFLLFFMSHNQ